jgi:hypothetical protein
VVPKKPRKNITGHRKRMHKYEINVVNIVF